MSLSRIATALALAVGASIALWAAARYATTDRIAFALVVTMIAGFALGAVETFRRLTAAEGRLTALAALPKRFDDAPDVDALPPSLGPAVLARLQDAPRPAATPHLTPFLLGLFVMLGLLGTFLGLFQTLAGTKEALSASADIAQLKAGLVAPMSGLTRSFGCSAAGVAASATLGLAAALARRAEAQFALAFDAWAKRALAPFRPQARLQATLDALLAAQETLADAQKSAAAAQAGQAEQVAALPEAARALGRAAEALGKLEGAVREGQRAQGEALARATEEGLAKATASMIAAASTHEASQRALAKETRDAFIAATAAHGVALEGALGRTRDAFAEAARRTEESFAKSAAVTASALGEDAKVLAQALAATATEIGRALDRDVVKIGENLEIQAKSQDARIAQTLSAVLEQAAAQREAIAALAASHGEATRRSEEALAALGVQVGGEVSAAQEALAARTQAVVEKLEGLVSGHAARLVDLEGGLAQRQEEQLARVAAALEDSARRFVRFEESLGAQHAAHLGSLFEKLAGASQTLLSFEEGIRAAHARHLEGLTALLGASARETSLPVVEGLGRAAAALEGATTRFAETTAAQGQATEELLRRISAHADAERSAAAARADEALAALRAAAETHLAGLAAVEERLLAAHEDRLGALGATLGAHAEATSKPLVDGIGQAAENLLAVAEKVEHAALTQTENLRRVAEETSAREEARGELTEARVTALAALLEDATREQREALAATLTDLARLHAEQLEALRGAAEARVAEVGAIVQGQAETVQAGAEAVQIGGAELQAAAELFATSVAVQKEASEAWLDRLRDVEGAVDAAGARAASQALAGQIDHVHELFARQLQFQRELYDAVRALRERDGALGAP